MNDFAPAVQISLLGIGLTFAALGLLAVIVFGLNWLFGAKRAAVSHASSTRLAGGDATPIQRDPEEDEAVVAIAIALGHLRSRDICRAGLGSSLEAGHGRWWRPTSQPLPNRVSLRRGRW